MYSSAYFFLFAALFGSAAAVCNIDTPLYTTHNGQTCSSWNGWTCSTASGYTAAQAADLVNNCGYSCADGCSGISTGITGITTGITTGINVVNNLFDDFWGVGWDDNNYASVSFGYGDTTFDYSGCSVNTICDSNEYDDVCDAGCLGSISSSCGTWARSSADTWCAFWDVACLDDDDDFLIGYDDDVFYDDNNFLSNNLYNDNVLSNNVLSNNILSNNVLSNNLYNDNVYSNNILSNNLYNDNLYSNNLLSNNLYNDNLYSNNLLSNNVYDDDLFYYDDDFGFDDDDDWFGEVCAGSYVAMSSFALAASVASVFALQAAF